MTEVERSGGYSGDQSKGNGLMAEEQAERTRDARDREWYVVHNINHIHH